jgi:hypothetical protein
MQNYQNYFPKWTTIQSIPEHDQYDLSSPLYNHYGIISCNPKTGILVMFYRKGTSNLLQYDYGRIYIRWSKDGGNSWTPEMPTYGTGVSPFDYRFLSGGYDNNGRLYIFFTLCDAFVYPPTNFGILYIYSDKDGIPGTWSGATSIVPQNSNYYKVAPYGQIIETGIPTNWGPTGIVKRHLYQTWFNYEDDYFKLWIAKFDWDQSSNSFVFISHINVYSGTTEYTYPSLVDLGGGSMLILARWPNNPGQYAQFQSDDYGATWHQPTPGFAMLDIWANNTSPPFLTYVNYQGIGLIFCYFTNLDSPIVVKCAIAVAGELLTVGVTKWNVISPIIAKVYNPLSHSHPYGQLIDSGHASFFHPLNQFKGIGISFCVDSLTHSYPQLLCTDSYQIIQNLNALL